MGVRNEWNTYTLGRYSEQPDATKLKATVKITDGTTTASLTSLGYIDVQTHTPEHCFAEDYDDAQTDQVIHTPNDGKKLRIRQVYVSTKTVNVDVTLKFSTSGKIIFKLYTSQKAAQAGNNICSTGDVDEGVELTCGDGTFVSIGYDEV